MRHDPPELGLTGVSWAAGGRLIVDDVTCLVPAGSMLGIIGPNGAGKTSLLRCIAQLSRPDRGIVMIAGEDIRPWKPRELARTVGVVLQDSTAEIDPFVRDVVLLGRIPHKGMFDRDDPGDQQRVADALRDVGMSDFGDRRWRSLSGGERQRVHLARALAQETEILLLDEPTSHLDLRFQLETLGLVKRLRVTAVAVLHDLNLASLFCDQLLVMQEGRAIRAGAPSDVLTEDLIRDVYGVEAQILTHPRTRAPTVVLLGPAFDQGADASGLAAPRTT